MKHEQDIDEDLKDPAFVKRMSDNNFGTATGRITKEESIAKWKRAADDGFVPAIEILQKAYGIEYIPQRGNTSQRENTDE